ncbi:hypothetical protein A3D06_01630 [Candidatus Roizmanbacteria bacterium RIFCSPHIGHO2_02_FULL_40_9]|uniref:Large ribosomal subunit protein uL22 n=2 Tax=Candidatus Roizmaniibacteriota TaxID=1752723 RepID=A0A1F7IKY6_9BACT|nr:MAG: hypothetical protein A3D06_01630 [Candidatus Roizmanbacteria bacterium RIFCSPHIGHO2_02_FULL_40_9]OGK44011.1 MAG: hypothetical protein A2957_01580 [Candidatus Roizmanbacteria bacterium RIFCSPLOWO2_01_FULL_38_11]
MESKAIIKHVRISPIKLRTLVDGIKVMHPQTALDRLSFSQKRSAKVLYKAIKSAVDNGKNKIDLQNSSVYFKKLSIDEGAFLKRSRAGSKGTGKPYKRKSSHITVIIEQRTTTNIAQLSKTEQKTKKTEKISTKKSEPMKKKIINKQTAK